MKKSQIEFDTNQQRLPLKEEGYEFLASRRDLNRRQRKLARQLKRELRERCFTTEIPEGNYRYAHSII